jgi:hypothetical protein
VPRAFFHPEVSKPCSRVCLKKTATHLPRDQLVVKPIAHCLLALPFPCQEVGCPRGGYRGSVRLFPHRSCHHSVPFYLLHPLPRCYCLPLLCRADQFYLLCISYRLTPSAFLPFAAFTNVLPSSAKSSVLSLRGSRRAPAVLD